MPLRIAGLRQGISVGHHQGPLRAAILEFKFHHKKILGDALGDLLAAKIAQMSWSLEMIIPVPMASNRGPERSFNPAEVIGRRLAAVMNRPCFDLLRARPSLAHQLGLRGPQRRENVRGAFTVEQGSRVEGKSILLIDDVTTTGATLSECASMVQKENPSMIYAAALAYEERKEP